LLTGRDPTEQETAEAESLLRKARRQVLKPNGKPVDAAAQVRAEREARARRTRRR